MSCVSCLCQNANCDLLLPATGVCFPFVLARCFFYFFCFLSRCLSEGIGNTGGLVGTIRKLPQSAHKLIKEEI
jgi:hypothetical protein